VAHEMFGSLGAAAFAERARAELEATGEHARRRTVEAPTRSPQEARIALWRAEGASNPTSPTSSTQPRTVESHLTKIYTKLGVSSDPAGVPDPASRLSDRDVLFAGRSTMWSLRCERGAMIRSVAPVGRVRVHRRADHR